MKSFLKQNLVLLTLICLLLPLIGCKAGGTTRRGTETLNTKVLYREKIMLPRKATISVTLSDVSKMDAAADVIARKSILPEGPPPYSIPLEYNASRIDPKHRYSVSARIEENGRLLFISDTHIDPFAVPAGEPVEILVRSVER